MSHGLPLYLKNEKRRYRKHHLYHTPGQKSKGNELTRLTSQLANVCKPITRAGIIISRHSGESAGTNWTATHSPSGCLEPVKKLGNQLNCKITVKVLAHEDECILESVVVTMQ